jgi:hypothetical protein
MNTEDTTTHPHDPIQAYELASRPFSYGSVTTDRNRVTYTVLHNGAAKIIAARGNTFRALLDSERWYYHSAALLVVQNAQRGDSMAINPLIKIPHQGTKRV